MGYIYHINYIQHTYLLPCIFLLFFLCSFNLLLTKIFVSFLLFRKIKVWDLVAALDPRAPAGTLCLRTLVVRLLLFSGSWGAGRRRN